MKYVKIIASLCLGFAMTSCDKNLEFDGTELEILSPINIDNNAGTWQTYNPMSPSEFMSIIPSPSEITSKEYLKELEEVKAEMANIDDNKRNIIRYWSSGGVLRWNQIMREMVAKNNLPPPENNLGQYPIPNASDPDNFNGTGISFPFSNPPYAARAYAYVSIAQYDALVMAMALKKLYARSTPNEVDKGISPKIVPTPQLKSYPSEDAVIASVSYEFMKRLFPKSEDTLFLFKKKEEQKRFKLWAGVSTRSDIEAGEKLGKAIFAKVFNRFRTDGMANAVGTPFKWDSLSKRCEEKGEIAWKSLENAPRPPMLPFFGNVAPWNMDRKTLAEISTSLPPFSTNSKEFQTQLAEVKNYAANPTREQIAIVHYWADGAGTHTPPGHWNQIAEKYFVSSKLSEVRTARNYALLNSALMDAAISCWYTKSYYYVPRPSQMDSKIKTLTGLPNFPAFTSGHSTFSSTAATVLSSLYPSAEKDLSAKAEEASKSRIYGGIHFRMDCEEGMKIGKIIANKAIIKAQKDGSL
jgi:hypothetical protein